MHVCNAKLRLRTLQIRSRPSGCRAAAAKGWTYHRSVVCHAVDAPEGTNSPTSSSRVRRVRLFRSTDQQERPAQSSDGTGTAPETAAASQPLVPVSEEFKKAFDVLSGTSSTKPARRGRRPAAAGEGTTPPPPPAAAAAAEAPAVRRTARQQAPGPEPRSSSRQQQQRDWDSDRHTDEPNSRSSSSSRAKVQRSPDASSSGDRDRRGSSSSSSSGRSRLRGLSDEQQRQRERWEREAEERQLEAERAERARLVRKERSERIPTQPKRNQDPVIFQALTRQWDEKVTQEEYRGARAAARKIARVGLEDRNRKIRNIRRKILQEAKQATQGRKEIDEETARLAQQATEQLKYAAALSIPKTREQLFAEAAGVKRSFARAEALPEGEWERLKREYKALKHPIKIGRQGAKPSLIQAIQMAWRGSEVVKLAIHDEKASRNANLPRMNLLLRELEERSGGVLIDTSGRSIWLYRGVDWKPAPVKPPYKPPAEEDRFTQEWQPKGSWRDIAGVCCYVVDGSSSSSSEASSSSSSSNVASSSAAMTLLFIPDQFPMADSQMQMQIADRAAAKANALVVMADLLGPPPSSPQSNLVTGGKAEGNKAGGYWLSRHWPLVKKRKLEYFDWYKTGPGGWDHQRPRFMAVLQELQQQGMYSKDASIAAAAAADAAAAAASAADGSSSSSSTKDEGSTSMSSSIGRPLGVLGLGWGSYVGLRAAGDEECVAEGLVAVACMSPTTFMFDSELSKNLRVPVAMLPAKYDTMDQLMNLVKLLNRPYLPRCLFRRFGKVKPGWASWLPQWIDNRAMFQAAETLLLAVGYLRRELLGDDSSPLLQLVLEEQREAEAELQLRIEQKFGYDKQQVSDQQDLEEQQGQEEGEEADEGSVE